MKPDSFNALIDSMTPEIWQNMKRAIEIGRWPDGRQLTAEQRELSLQAVIAWEIKQNIPEEERTGYLKRKCPSSQDQPVSFKN